MGNANAFRENTAEEPKRIASGTCEGRPEKTPVVPSSFQPKLHSQSAISRAARRVSSPPLQCRGTLEGVHRDRLSPPTEGVERRALRGTSSAVWKAPSACVLTALIVWAARVLSAPPPMQPLREATGEAARGGGHLEDPLGVPEVVDMQDDLHRLRGVV